MFTRILSDAGFDVPTMLFARQSIAVVLLLVVILVFDRSMLRIRARDAWIFVVAGVGGVFGLNMCYTAALEELSLSLAAVLLSMFPIFVMAMSLFLFGERITPKKAGCTAAAIIGCVLVTGVFESTTTWSAAGIGIGIGAAIFYAIYSVVSKLATDRGYGVLTITFYSFLLVTICLIPFSNLGTIGSYVSSDPLPATGFLILHSLCATTLPYALYTAAFRYMDAGKVAILGCAEPIAATVFGAAFFAEYPSVLAAAGLAIAVVALAVMCIPGKPEEGPNTPAPSSRDHPGGS